MCETSLKHLKDPNFGQIPQHSNKNILKLTDPHIDSFNYCVDEGLVKAVKSIPEVEFCTIKGDKVRLTIKDAEISKPMVPLSSGYVDNLAIYPKECIEKGSSYKGVMYCSVAWSINNEPESFRTLPIGDVPIMVKSRKCHLYKAKPKELVKHGELINETGGYFIINGNRKVLRMLIANRRNYPLALERKTWKQRDSLFTDKGILIRCVASDETTSINVLHYLTNGTAKMGITVGKQIIFLPVMLCLRIFMGYNDKFIYDNVIRGKEQTDQTTKEGKENIALAESVKIMLRELQGRGLYTQDDCKDYIGKTFRSKVTHLFNPTNSQICDFLFKTYVLTHLENDKAKFLTLCSMIRKLYSFVHGGCKAESVDSFSMQEVVLGGFTFLQILKEKLSEFLVSIKYQILVQEKVKASYEVTHDTVKAAILRGKAMKDFLLNFIATGSLVSKSGCGLMQKTGLTVMLENINRMRDLSHFRAIHRGTFFLEMKSIGPRRLSGEAWGFICPVHTPDGAPCGLLNHLAFDCHIPCERPSASLIPKLKESGMAFPGLEQMLPIDKYFEVFLDGELVGFIPEDEAPSFIRRLRSLKIQEKIYKFTEIVYIPRRKYSGQYPGVFLFTSPARFMRPVFNTNIGLKETNGGTSTNRVEYLGCFEQLYINVATCKEDFQSGVHTHMEREKTSILSNIAKLVPFSDCNPNPRNMYQCQMGKQTLGTAHHNYLTQTSGKTYRLQYPQVPLVRNAHYDKINMEEFCMGFNAVLAIVSYTGYDMEDAMVINKCAMERGLAHGQVYKSEFVDLTLLKGLKSNKSTEVRYIFKRDPLQPELEKFLDELGLPYPGTILKAKDPYYCYHDLYQDSFKVANYVGEDCVVDKCSIINKGFNDNNVQRVNITIRVRRDPIIGDKFASRSGQKGIMSRLYPIEDMPFTERGIVPDIIFNPHGIPSRMTAGKLLELIAGKGAAEYGVSFDSTPFRFSDENPAYKYFGEILQQADFNYYGEDVMYSGTDGRMMEVEVFEGIVYYQRLRHMTADKWQVRAKGAVDPLTRQPIKGRKRGGAIRFGEMERDGLISHGAAFALKDRLLDCSDSTREWICTACGCLLSPIISAPKNFGGVRKEPKCSLCEKGRMEVLEIPYAFKYLVTELAAVGIRLKINTKAPEEVIRVELPPPLACSN